MRLKQYDEKDGRKVWLSRTELDLFLEQADDTETKIAFLLAARCGLRAQEIVDVTALDVIEDETVGPRVRVQDGKGGKYREIPANRDLKTTVDTFDDIRDAPAADSLVDRSTRTIQRWVRRAAQNCRAETSDAGWQFLGPHDLRRTWGTLLVEDGVEPGMIMEWGGWSDWETFRKHYLGAYSPEMERYQASKVSWLGSSNEDTQSGPATPGSNMSRSRFEKESPR